MQVTGRDFFSFRPELGGGDDDGDEGGNFDEYTARSKGKEEEQGDGQEGQAADQQVGMFGVREGGETHLLFCH